MSCVYVLNWNGKQLPAFLSELALDEFLLINLPLESKLRDTVYSKNLGSEKQSAEWTSLLKSLFLRIALLYQEDKLEIIKNKKRQSADPDGDSDTYKDHFGVNEFLDFKTFVDSAGEEHHLHPIFKSEEYWKRRFESWARLGDASRFTKDEIDTLFNGDEAKAAATIVNDASVLERYLKAMQQRWERLCLIGDAFHAIMKVYFGYNNATNSYWCDSVGSNADAMINALKNKTFKALDGGKEYPFSTILTKDQVKDALAYAKSLLDDVRATYGEHCVICTEVPITAMLAEGQGTETKNKIAGSIDLLVIDSRDAAVHILDYKVTPRSYVDIQVNDRAKERTYMFLLEMYRRMLELAGLNMTGATMEVVPVLTNGFGKQADGSYTYKDINKSQRLRERLNDKINALKVSDRLVDTLLVTLAPDDEVDNVLEGTDKFIQHNFIKYNRTQHYTEEEIRDLIDEVDGFTPAENGMLIYKTAEMPADKAIKVSRQGLSDAEAEAALVRQVHEFYNQQDNRRVADMNTIIAAVRDAIAKKDIDLADWPLLWVTENNTSHDFIKHQLSLYCTGTWEICDNGAAWSVLQLLGVIAFKNKLTNLIDFVKISNKQLKTLFNFISHSRKSGNVLTGKRTYLAGAHHVDSYYDSKTDNLMLHCELGNIELMELMYALNLMAGIFRNDKAIVGRIQVLNPTFGYGVTTNNERILYSFNELMKNSEGVNKVNNFANGSIKMASEFQIAQDMLTNIQEAATGEKLHNPMSSYERYKNLGGVKSMFEITANDSNAKKLMGLRELLKTLQESFSADTKALNLTDIGHVKQAHLLLYHLVLLAIAECKGVNFLQLLRDHAKFCEDWHIWLNGWHGSYMDNSGMLESETLNLLTKLCEEGYQNARDEMAPFTAKLNKLVRDFRSSLGTTWLASRTVSNQTSIYQNLYEKDLKQTGGDFLFKNVTDMNNGLNTAERAFLKEALRMINRRRMPLLANETFEQREKRFDTLEAKYDVKYYQVPLLKGHAASLLALKGAWNALKDFFNGFKPSEIVKRARESAEGLFTPKLQYEIEKNTASIFEISNDFELGRNSVLRANLIAQHATLNDSGLGYFETDLETILFQHEFAYAKSNALNEVMPLAKAAMVHLIQQGIMAGEQFSNDLDYFNDYVMNKIKSLSITEKKFEKFGMYGAKLRKAASLMALGMAPVQGIYLHITGLWNTISLCIRKPDGTDMFSLKNFTKAYKLVFKDVVDNVNDKPTVISRLNELIGMNDMDINLYTKRIATNKHGMWNADNILFKFASRPDYFNRMAILVAKMIHDGSFEAYSLDSEGKLVYDFTKDARFNALKNPSHPDYAKQRSLYYAMATQFVNEHTKNPDGSLFTLDMVKMPPLPRAYTTKELESIKAVCDEIYGYYTHEKKSMILSTALGCFWMQMRTFWSGKKNLFLQKGGIKLEGKWVLATNDNNEKLYYQVNENGIPDSNLPPTTEDTGFPMTVWKGDFKEGIFVTLGLFIHDWKENDFHLAVLNYKNNEDASISLARKSNTIKFFYDITLMLAIGCFAGSLMTAWYKELDDEADRTSIADAITLTGANLAVRSLHNSVLDFNFFDSIGTPVVNWTPFAFLFMSALAKALSETVFGDRDATDTALRMFAATRQTKPFWDCVRANINE